MTLSGLLDAALERGEPALHALRGATPADRADRFATLLSIYDLHAGPITESTRYQNHPVVAELKHRLESEWLAELGTVPPEVDDVTATMRALAAKDRLPAAYEYVAREASWDELVRFLALEGGPAGGFDDLVAACQIGLTGLPKVELARNYWDEIGNGDPAAVHTVLHERLVAAVGMPRIPREEQSAAALERAALGGLLATNHWLQPEMLGALGLIELQAGPRCRLVLAGLTRLGAPADAFPFYEVHAEVDPRHGQDWLVNAIVPVLETRPEWAGRIVLGAQWRSRVNAAFFAELEGALRQAA